MPLLRQNETEDESAFDYVLPESRIAQRPLRPYDSARLMVVSRSTKVLTDRVFIDLPLSLSEKDVLVFNNTKVIPARLFGELEGSDGQVEVLLLKEEEGVAWKVMGRPLRKFTVGRRIVFRDGYSARVVSRVGEKEALIEFEGVSPRELKAAISSIGTMPIPPYVRGGRSDNEDSLDYQTPFGKHEGSVASPTASLHFTEELIQRIKHKGCRIEETTLHLGAASFLPLWNEGESASDLKPPTSEIYFYSPDLLRILMEVKQEGGRVIAVGTSVVRSLESMVRQESSSMGEGWYDTSLFIKPAFEFQLVDCMITNFHQPRTTHLLLVEAFMGRGLLRQAYERALDSEYRFLSYGDGMFIS